MADAIDLSDRSVAALQPEAEYRALEHYSTPEGCLSFVFRNRNTYLILRYAELKSIEPIPGEDANRVVLLRFCGSVTREVRIDGTRLLDLVRDLRSRRVA
jgi:hypothetical protein